jgi:chromosome partitioning protein
MSVGMHKIVFFNNKGGVGKTTMVYNLSYMFSELGYRVLSVDLDPQSNLSALFLDEDRLYETFDEQKRLTVRDAINPIVEGEGLQGVHVEAIDDNIALLIGSLSLSLFEDKFSDAWLKCLDGDIYSFKVISSFKTIIEVAARQHQADVVLIDVGPNLGAINRTALLSSDTVIIPVASDMFSLQGIKNLGNTLKTWKNGWARRLASYQKDKSEVPAGEVQPGGYVIMQYTAKERRPVKAYLRFADRIPNVYRSHLLGEGTSPVSVMDDQNCLGLLKHYHSLAPMSMEANKPLFLLKPSDGAIGAHVKAVRKAYQDFEEVTRRIIQKCSLSQLAVQEN